METEERRATSATYQAQTALVISDVRFLCESVIAILTGVPGIIACEHTDTLETALSLIGAYAPAIVLIDVAMPNGLEAAARICRLHPELSLIALGVRETEKDVLDWVEAGIAGYVPNTSSVSDMLALIAQIRRGEQSCTAKIAGSLLRRIARASKKTASHDAADEQLTRREREVRDLVNAGLSNKEIARRLRISLSTTKTHVHHVLGKLGATRRSTVIATAHGPVGRASV
jgi:DNA-binding NarL/FixJ family response regulator